MNAPALQPRLAEPALGMPPLFDRAREASRDRALVERFRGGDQSAFDELVACHWGRIFSMVHRLLRDARDAEEITQDAFLRAYRHLSGFRGDSSFSTWLHEIAVNLAHSRWAYWQRRGRCRTVSIDQPSGPDHDGTLMDTVPSESASPKDQTMTRELVDRVTLCINRLHPKYRRVLVLRNVHHLSYGEIADALGVKVNTVKSRIFRARECLRKRIGAEYL